MVSSSLSWRLLVAAISFSVAAPTLATGPREEAKAASPGEDPSAALSNKIRVSDVGLFMPDDRWKKMKTGIPEMKVGGWTEYEVSHPDINLGTLRISVVPQRDLPTPSWRVLEFKSTDATGDATYVKVAFPRPTTDLRKARGMLFKMTGMPPFVVPIGAGEHEGEGDAFTVQAEYSPTLHADVRYLGKASITVPAGRFETWHYRITGRRVDGSRYDSHLWLDTSRRVPVLRVVKAVEGDTTMELRDMGTGAKTDLPYLEVERARADQGMGNEKTK